MTTKQKIAIAVGTGLISAYMVIFVYQRIQRAKADKSIVSEEEALKILNQKSSVTEPDFSEEDLKPILPNNEVIDNSPSELLMDFEVLTGYGDY